MISRLQQQAQGFENYRERGQQAMDNFDTDKAIQQGTEIAYRHGTALLNQGREQLEAMAGTEIVAGAPLALPTIVKTHSRPISLTKDWLILELIQTKSLYQLTKNMGYLI